jgi:hypothetical protein
MANTPRTRDPLGNARTFIAILILRQSRVNVFRTTGHAKVRIENKVPWIEYNRHQIYTFEIFAPSGLIIQRPHEPPSLVDPTEPMAMGFPLTSGHLHTPTLCLWLVPFCGGGYQLSWTLNS